MESRPHTYIQHCLSAAKVGAHFCLFPPYEHGFQGSRSVLQQQLLHFNRPLMTDFTSFPLKHQSACNILTQDRRICQKGSISGGRDTKSTTSHSQLCHHPKAPEVLLSIMVIQLKTISIQQPNHSSPEIKLQCEKE